MTVRLNNNLGIPQSILKLNTTGTSSFIGSSQKVLIADATASLSTFDLVITSAPSGSDLTMKNTSNLTYAPQTGGGTLTCANLNGNSATCKNAYNINVNAIASGVVYLTDVNATTNNYYQLNTHSLGHLLFAAGTNMLKYRNWFYCKWKYYV